MNRLVKMLSALLLAAGCVAGAWGQDLVGQWSGTVTQTGPGDVRETYPTRMRLDGLTGQIDYPSLQCGGTLSFVNKNGDFYYYTEHITYGDCVDGGMVAVLPGAGSVDWAWNTPGITVSGTLSGSRRLPPCKECQVNLDRCFTGCAGKYTLIERSDCENRCRAEYPCTYRQTCE